MSNLITKSEENIKSAELLIENKFFNSSVHCSYYSCVQLMKSIILVNMNQEDFDNETKKTKGTHLFLKIYFLKEFQKRDRNLSHKFKVTLDSLIESRINTDYRNLIFEKMEDAKEILTNAKYLNDTLKNNFKDEIKRIHNREN